MPANDDCKLGVANPARKPLGNFLKVKLAAVELFLSSKVAYRMPVGRKY